MKPPKSQQKCRRKQSPQPTLELPEARSAPAKPAERHKAGLRSRSIKPSFRQALLRALGALTV